MAVANAVLDIVLADGFLLHVVQIGNELADRMNDIAERYPAVIQSIRGTGLMLGIKCAAANTDLAARLTENGLLTILAADNVVRFLPPLIIESAHVNEACEILEKSCAELSV